MSRLNVNIGIIGALALPVFLIFPVWYSGLLSMGLKKKVWLWCQQEGIKPEKIQFKIFKRGPLTFKTNSLQTVFNVKGNSGGKPIEVWLVFGSQFYGLLSKKFEVVNVKS